MTDLLFSLTTQPIFIPCGANCKSVKPYELILYFFKRKEKKTNKVGKKGFIGKKKF
jgi:hypothetical protein